jgi:hypothetical protein
LDLVGDAKLKAQQEAEEKLVAAINTTGNKTTEVELEDRIIIDDQANREKILREGYEHAWYSSDSVNRLVTAPWFDLVITATIILNTIVLMTYHFDPDVEGGMSSGFTAFLAYTNYTFTVVFYIEALLKIYGLSFGIYWRDGFNKFDFVVVVLSVIELLLVALNPGSVAFLSAFRTFRLLRVFKLAKNWPSLQKLVKTVVGTLDQVAYFSLLLVIFIYVFALLGMQLYAGKLYDDEGEVFRSNYDTFWWAVITVFQIIGGENWNDVMTNGIASNDWGAALYFVVLFVIGNYLVLNLFLAILLSNFDDDDEKDDAEKLKIQVEGEPQPKQKKKKKKKRRFFRSGRKHKTPVAAEDMPVIHTRHGRFRGPSVIVTNDIELKVRAAEAEHHKTRKDRTASLPVSGGKTGEEYVLSPGLERATTKNNITVVGVDKSDTGHVLSATSDLKVLEIPEDEEEIELQDAADFAAKTSEKKVNVSIFIPTHGQQGYWVSPVVGTSTFFALKPDHWFRK